MFDIFLAIATSGETLISSPPQGVQLQRESILRLGI
jgi:hypothetical protein